MAAIGELLSKADSILKTYHTIDLTVKNIDGKLEDLRRELGGKLEDVRRDVGGRTEELRKEVSELRKAYHDLAIRTERIDSRVDRIHDDSVREMEKRTVA